MRRQTCKRRLRWLMLPTPVVLALLLASSASAAIYYPVDGKVATGSGAFGAFDDQGVLYSVESDFDRSRLVARSRGTAQPVAGFADELARFHADREAASYLEPAVDLAVSAGWVALSRTAFDCQEGDTDVVCTAAAREVRVL